MDGFKWLLFCMVILNSGPDDIMSVSGLDCFVCFYIKKNNATKQTCINSISSLTLPCNDDADYQVALDTLEMQEKAEVTKLRPEFLDKRNQLSLKAGNGDGGNSTNGHKYFCAVATEVVAANEVIGADVTDGTVTVVSHGCLQASSDDAKSLIVDKCNVDIIDGFRNDFYVCQNGFVDGKPCNFDDDKCKTAGTGSSTTARRRFRPPRIPRRTTSRTSKLMPVTIGLYILILIGIATIANCYNCGWTILAQHVLIS